MRLPNLFTSARGRLAAFFLLYVTEGVPLGFATIAVATQLRRQGVGPAEIGAFVGSFYLPWAFKWAFGPVVDVFHVRRWGRRRGWIIAMQCMMAVTLMSSALLDLPRQMALFTLILLVHNVFAATQDVAIDALAVNTLDPDQRATANGMMFAGANIGQLIGGSGSLLMASYWGFQSAFGLVVAIILCVTVLVVLPFKEPELPHIDVQGAPRSLRAALGEVHGFAMTAFRSFLGSRGAFAALGMALLPPGAMCLGLALQTNLAVELGMDDPQVAWLSMWSSLLAAVGCICGGLISDRVDRRKALTVYIALMSLPIFAMAWALQQHGWIRVGANQDGRLHAALPSLVTALWICTVAYNFCNGLMYSTANAIYMDVTNPAVAGTQFTAYMAMGNVAISYSATWEGISAEHWGYPTTLVIDGLFGFLFLILLPLTRQPLQQALHHTLDGMAPARARQAARILAVMCLLWLPVQLAPVSWQSLLAVLQPLFSVVFVGASLFLLAGSSLLRTHHRRRTRAANVVGLLLLAMLARAHVPTHPAEGLLRCINALLLALPAAGAVLLGWMSRCPWSSLRPSEAASPPSTEPTLHVSHPNQLHPPIA